MVHRDPNDDWDYRVSSVTIKGHVHTKLFKAGRMARSKAGYYWTQLTRNEMIYLAMIVRIDEEQEDQTKIVEAYLKSERIN